MTCYSWVILGFVSVQEIELTKAQWSTLFEPYLFFESYKNYLQVDIVAEDAVDLLAWRGWVESRLRQLTLKVLFSLTGPSYVIKLAIIVHIVLADYCLYSTDRERHKWHVAVPSLPI